MTEFRAPPISAPLYLYEHGQQLRYPGAELLMVMYAAERERVAHLVPTQCDVPKTPNVICYIARYDSSPVGPYLEAATLIEASVETSSAPVSGWFVASMYVTTDAAMALGREVFGFPRKLAQIELDAKGEAKRGRVVRGGVQLMELRIEPDWEVEELPDGNVIRVLNLKLVPSADLCGKVSAELISSDIGIPNPGSIRVGSAAIELGESTDDPIHVLAPGKNAGKLMGAVVKSEFELGPGKVVRTLT
ncbi:MAG: acetoacetate decarboxylase family protein [Deltaproteobacteria bacterium]|nr:acetoacetate decarboxylase family protein [Deltaproteobacteria bacterium]